jgi:hypothetical protein
VLFFEKADGNMKSVEIAWGKQIGGVCRDPKNQKLDLE